VPQARNLAPRLISPIIAVFFKQKHLFSYYFIMKRKDWLITLAVGAGAGAVAYSLLSKSPIPKGATVAQPFDLEKYMGTWNEVARLPNFIEKNINQLTETYNLKDDGTFEVITRAHNVKKNKWTEVSGKGKSAGVEDVGMLKVSYFGPFYLAYNVLDIDPDYQYALVSGSGLNYLWILSRKNNIPDNVRDRFLIRASEIGFDVDALEWL
jgi:apolipoprotein D and lipocalin family protein